MLRELHTAAMGMIPQMTRLEVISNNIANVSTPGFRREVVFEHALTEAKRNLYNTQSEPEPEDTTVGTYYDFSKGGISRSGNPLDFAINGDGFFTVMDAEGNELLTRTGRFMLNPQGFVTTPDGKMLLGDGGPIQIPMMAGTLAAVNPDVARASQISVAENGEVFFNEIPINAIRLTQVENPQTLRRNADQTFIPTSETVLNETFEGDKMVKQFHLEGSNVNIVSEMVQMIEAQRQFEFGQKVIQTNDSTLDFSIELGRFS